MQVQEYEHICRDFRLREDREDREDGESSQHFAVDVELQTRRLERVTPVTEDAE